MHGIKYLFGLVILITYLSGCVKSKEVKPNEVKYLPKKVIERSGAKSWIFDEQPPIDLENRENFIHDVNIALRAAELPEIYSWVTEKSNITSSRYDRTIYEWPDYPLGVLQVKRSSSRNWEENGNHYDVIWKITLQEKK